MWWIDIDDAVRIYARMLRARLGSRRGAKAALEKADYLRARGDSAGVKAWEAVAAELTPPNPKGSETVDPRRVAAPKRLARTSTGLAAKP